MKVLNMLKLKEPLKKGSEILFQFSEGGALILIHKPLSGFSHLYRYTVSLEGKVHPGITEAVVDYIGTDKQGVFLCPDCRADSFKFTVCGNADLSVLIMCFGSCAPFWRGEK